MHYNGCNYLSMLGLKLNHVSKRGPCANKCFFQNYVYIKWIWQWNKISNEYIGHSVWYGNNPGFPLNRIRLLLDYYYNDPQCKGHCGHHQLCRGYGLIGPRPAIIRLLTHHMVRWKYAVINLMSLILVHFSFSEGYVRTPLAFCPESHWNTDPVFIYM